MTKKTKNAPQTPWARAGYANEWAWLLSGLAREPLFAAADGLGQDALQLLIALTQGPGTPRRLSTRLGWTTERVAEAAGRLESVRLALVTGEDITFGDAFTRSDDPGEEGMYEVTDLLYRELSAGS